MLVPIHVLSRDGQSILESRDTLTRKVGVIFSKNAAMKTVCTMYILKMARRHWTCVVL